MSKKIGQLLLVSATAFFCSVALASTLPFAGEHAAMQADNPFTLVTGAGSSVQEPLLLASNDHFFYCKVGSKGTYGTTKKGSAKKVNKYINKDPLKYLAGTCEENNIDAKGSKGSKVTKKNGSKKKEYVYYCQVKEGSKGTKYKNKKGSQKKVDKKISKKPGKYFLGKCEDIFSIS